MPQKAVLIGLGILLVAAVATARDAAEVTDVYDGDTITARPESGNKVKVRLIGIDTPEIADNPHGPASVYGPVSRDYLDALLIGGAVELEYDVTKTDRYGRTLAYVYLPNGVMANEQLLRAGYALLYTVPPNVKYVDRFTAAQTEARNANKGLWAFGALGGTGTTTAPTPAPKITPEPEKPSPATGKDETVYITKTGSKYHRAGCRYTKKSCIPISKKDAKARGYSP